MRELAVFINCSIDTTGQQYVVDKNVAALLEKIFTTQTENKDLINRSLNLLSNISRDKKGAETIATSKLLVSKLLHFFNKAMFS